MGQRSSFAAMKAEQARMTESWKAEGRQSEAWVIADPEIVEIFAAGVSFGMEMGRRRDGAYSQENGEEHCARPWNERPNWKSSWTKPKRGCGTRNKSITTPSGPIRKGILSMRCSRRAAAAHKRLDNRRRSLFRSQCLNWIELRCPKGRNDRHQNRDNHQRSRDTRKCPRIVGGNLVQHRRHQARREK